MPDALISHLRDPRAMTVLLSATMARCTKIFRPDGNGGVAVDSYDFGYMWYPTVLAVPHLQGLHEALTALSGARSRCVIRGSLREGIDSEFGVPRLSTGSRATFEDSPRHWVAVDVDGYDGSLSDFMRRFTEQYPLFAGCGHVVQRTSSFGMRPGLSVRLWYYLNLPASTMFWRQFFSGPAVRGLGIDNSIYKVVHIHYTAAPIFLDGVPDPCAERVTFVPGVYDEIDLLAFPDAQRLASMPSVAGDSMDAAEVPEVGHPVEIENALQRIGRQQTDGAGHTHAYAAARELFAMGCPYSRAEPVLYQLISQAHGRTPRPNEVEEMWNDAARAAASGVLRTTNPPGSVVFAEDPPPPALPEVAQETAQEVAAAELGEWVSDPHVNASRFLRMTLRGFLHWSAMDYELMPEGYWRRFETEDTLAFRASNLTRMKRAKCTELAFALRAQNLREYLNPPCRLSTNQRLDDVMMLRNGYMLLADVKAGRRVLHPHDPDHFTESVLGCSFNPDATCPRFDRFINEIFPDDEASRLVVLRMMAYFLLPDVRFQKFFMLTGVSSSGKSTLAKLINVMVGPENVVGITRMEDLLGDFGLAPLLGKHVIYLPEANTTGSGRNAAAITNIIKQITGADQVTVNRKNCPQLSVQLPGRIVLTCNQPPEFGDDSGALRRRLVVVRFNRSFEDSPEVGLEGVLAAERDGILNRLLEVLPGLYDGTATGGFHTPDSAREEQEQVLRDASPIGTFISDCLSPDPRGVISSTELAAVASRWCSENNVPLLSAIAIGRVLARKPHVRRFNRNGRGFEGVTLSPDGLRLRAGCAL